MADRMRRQWMPFRTGFSGMAGLDEIRISINSLINTALDRNLRDFTVTRLIFGFSAVFDSGTPETVSLGVRFENDNVVVGTVDPAADSQAEWIYWEEVVGNVGTMHQRDRIIRDIRSQRMSRGFNQEMFFYITNNGAVAGDFMLSGRALVLIR